MYLSKVGLDECEMKCEGFWNIQMWCKIYYVDLWDAEKW